MLSPSLGYPSVILPNKTVALQEVCKILGPHADFPESCVLKPGYFSLEMWKTMIMEAGGIPLHDINDTRVEVEITYFNINMLDRTNSLNYLAATLTNATGPFGYYPVIINGGFGVNSLFADACQTTGSCIVIAIGTPIDSDFICTNPLPADCIKRNKRIGFRRFDTLYAPLPSFTPTQSQQLAFFRQQGIKNIALFSTDIQFDVNIFQSSKNSISSLRLNLVYQEIFSSTATQAWTVDEAVTRIRTMKSLNVQGLIYIALAPNVPSWTAQQITNMYLAMQQENWLPQGLNFQAISIPTIDPALLQYTFVYISWNERVRGLDFQAINSSTNLELFGATSELDSPQVFAQVFTKKFGPIPPSYLPQPSIYIQSPTIIHKLIELSGSIQPSHWIQQATIINTPSHYGPIKFDFCGRAVLVPENQIILQYVGATKATQTLIPVLPLTIQQEFIFPMPKWSERIYNPVIYNNVIEQAIATLTVISMIICGLLLWFTIWRRHISIIKAASPTFLVLCLVFGIILLSSNLANTLMQTDVTCAFQIWLLTCGFNGMFGAIGWKTYRVAKIFNSRNLNDTRKQTTGNLLIRWCTTLSIDIVLNVIWMIVEGMKTVYISVDIHRPSLDYSSCASSNNAKIFCWISLGLKLFYLLVASLQAYRTRNVPSEFNESVHLGRAIYTIFIISALFLPIILTNVITTRTSLYVVRCIGIIAIVMLPTLYLFGSKIYVVFTEDLSLFTTTSNGTNTKDHTIAEVNNFSLQSQLTNQPKSIPTPKDNQPIDVKNQNYINNKMFVNQKSLLNTPQSIPQKSVDSNFNKYKQDSPLKASVKE